MTITYKCCKCEFVNEWKDKELFDEDSGRQFTNNAIKCKQCGYRPEPENTVITFYGVVKLE
mgnify:CR=1 FL=1